VHERLNEAVRASGYKLVQKSVWYNEAIRQLLAIRPSVLWHGIVTTKASGFKAARAPTTKLQFTIEPETRMMLNEAIPGLVRYCNRTGAAEVEWYNLLGTVVRVAIEMRVTGQLIDLGLDPADDWGDQLEISETDDAIVLTIAKPRPGEGLDPAQLDGALEDALEVVRERLGLGQFLSHDINSAK
jgi:hypothetical protein